MTRATRGEPRSLTARSSGWTPDLVAFQEVPRAPSPAGLSGLLAGTALTATHQSDVLAYQVPFEDQYGGTALATRWPHRIVEIADQRGLQSLHGASVHYHDAWQVAAENSGTSDPGYTWSTDNPAAAREISAIVRQPGYRRRLDYVFTGSWHAHPQARAEVRAATLVLNQPDDGLWPSDHSGVLVDLDVTTDS
jgi:endonuclease/exonuclease/phosphatase family metal-dependent hydrolase